MRTCIASRRGRRSHRARQRQKRRRPSSLSSCASSACASTRRTVRIFARVTDEMQTILSIIFFSSELRCASFRRSPRASRSSVSEAMCALVARFSLARAPRQFVFAQMARRSCKKRCGENRLKVNALKKNNLFLGR